MKTSDNFSYYQTKFFSEYLPGQRNVSLNTIRSYRDSFVILIKFFQSNKSISPEKLKISTLTRANIESFLLYLETVKHSSIATGNQRLAAIKSFMKYIQVEEPEHLYLCQNILNIRNKKSEKVLIEYLSPSEVQCLLEQPDTTNIKGRRDLAILSLLYDSAARVQELCDAKVEDIRLEEPAVIRLYGKGRKKRTVPLSKNCSAIMRKYMSENNLDQNGKLSTPLFYSNRNKKLTRSGMSYILSKYMEFLYEQELVVRTRKITPHCLRHSKAMHLVESGVNLIYIRDFLGHESIETTQIYARANPESVRKAIMQANISDKSPSMPDWNEDPDLLKYLKSL